ncbi:MAG: undecaprenyldiphospho-muramoylpentapeptide beta-N-acetylglucosaminyltransferase [Verrucomicrobiae bacterium]|nr:undecaprenyldiphospho-muramoylpentapeptide beta-N-acetylglucosaminyltransferase [Verrucomicrobiae bacterium]
MNKAHVAVACGGTGGHIFPGLAIADKLIRNGCDVTLLISQKEIDRRACASISNLPILELPAYPLNLEGFFRFFSGSFRSISTCFKYFKNKPLHAVFSTGGFTSLAPIVYGKLKGSKIYIHESNSIPGKANKILSHLASQVYIGFKSAQKFLPESKVKLTGTPVRPAFFNLDQQKCRLQLGIDPNRETLLIAGGSQGARPINELVLSALSIFKERLQNWQFLHVTGANDFELVKNAYEQSGLPSKIYDFTDEMPILLGAATVAVSRAGASFLSELAAAKVPPVLIPYPFAADNHQFYNALTFVKLGAARMLEQNKATPELLTGMILQLSEDSQFRMRSLEALSELCFPDAADTIANHIITGIKTKFNDKVSFQPSGSIWTKQTTNNNNNLLTEHSKTVLVK